MSAAVKTIKNHSAEAGPLTQQQCDSLYQPTPLGSLPGAE